MAEDRPTEDAGNGGRSPSDPVTRILVVAVSLVIVVLLGSVATLVWYATGYHPPRNEVERQLATAEQSAKAKPKVVQNWVVLALAQANAGQYAEAESSVASGRRISNVAVLDTAYAQIAALRGDKAEAIRRYDVAKKRAKEEWAARVKDYASKGIRVTATNDLLIQALVSQASVYQAMGRHADAKAQLDAALRENPQMADVLARRADAEAALGDAKAARRDYEQALKFVPGLDAAEQGLRRLEGK